MSKDYQIEMSTDWVSYCALVDSTVKELASRKGNQDGLQFFGNSYHAYAKAIIPVAEALERKYSELVSEELHYKLKRQMEKRFEQGLEIFHRYVTEERYKHLWGGGFSGESQ